MTLCLNEQGHRPRVMVTRSNRFQWKQEGSVMSDYLTVEPGIDMRKALGRQRLTKKWVREYLRDNPQKDFKVVSVNHRNIRTGTYVNGEDAIRHDLTLDVVHPANGNHVAFADFQPCLTEVNEWGYQAVVS